MAKRFEGAVIKFKRYPHVEHLIRYYAQALSVDEIISILNLGVGSSAEAETFSRFIWKMLDAMSDDIESKVEVLGGTDNSSMIPDIDYEVSLYLSEAGYEEIWDRIADEENPD